MVSNQQEQTRRVLIIDDSIVARMVVEKILRECVEDIHIAHAGNAEQALEIIKTEVFDYITIDYNMPGMSGADLAKEIRLVHPDAKMALVTANKQKAIKERAAGIGVPLIEKPDIKIPLQDFING